MGVLSLPLLRKTPACAGQHYTFKTNSKFQLEVENGHYCSGPVKFLSGVSYATILKVAHDALWGIAQHRHVLVGRLA